MRSLFLIVIAVVQFVAVPLFGAGAAKVPVRKSASSPPSPVDAPALTPLETEIRGPQDKYRFTSGLGVRVLRNETAISTATRLAVRPGRSLYLLGFEAEFSFFSPGSVLGVLGGGWYETRVSGAPRLSVAIGILGGAGFASRMTEFTSTVPVVFLETAIIQEVDELVSMQGQFRPGFIGGYFSFSMNLSVSFRFY